MSLLFGGMHALFPLGILQNGRMGIEHVLYFHGVDVLSLGDDPVAFRLAGGARPNQSSAAPFYEQR